MGPGGRGEVRTSGPQARRTAGAGRARGAGRPGPSSRELVQGGASVLHRCNTLAYTDAKADPRLELDLVVVAGGRSLVRTA